MDIDGYKKLAGKLCEQDRKRNEAFTAYEAMWHNEWAMPADLSKYDYMHKVTDHSPHDAIKAGVNVLTGNPVRVKVLPSQMTEEQQTAANEWERVLKWQLMQANRRRPVSIEADTALSALLFQAAAMTVIDIDWQITQVKALNANTKRLDNARRYGKYIVNTYNPKDVHVLRSSYGVEYVVLAQERLASEVMYEWGDAAKGLKEASEGGKMVKYYYCMGYDEWACWVEGDEDLVLLAPKQNELPFLPWVAMMGGSTLETLAEHQYHSILYPLYQTGSWETLNVVSTLAFTEAIAQAFKKDKVVDGDVDMDYTNPDGIMQVPQGTNVQQLSKQPLDPAKMQMMDQLRSNIERATVSRLLQGGDVAAESFAGLNLMTQTAVGALKPAKDLTQNALAEMFTLMVLWADYTDTPITGKGMSKEDAGDEYKIDPQLIDVNNLYIQAELNPQLPTDMMQRANVASLVVPLGYSKKAALSDLGVDDPEKMLEESFMEQLDEAQQQLIIQGMQMQQQQAADAQAQQQAEAQAMAQQEAQQGPIMGGQGFNPGMGGTPPAVAAPTYTREDVTGEDAAGNPMVSGL
jgi:hypothetical protein